MILNPSSDSAPILGLVSLKEGETFDRSKAHTYSYETIGGNHSRIALQELVEELDNPSYRTRLVSVYQGLSDRLVKRLAHKHNHATSLHHEMSTWEKVTIILHTIGK